MTAQQERSLSVELSSSRTGRTFLLASPRLYTATLIATLVDVRDINAPGNCHTNVTLRGVTNTGHVTPIMSLLPDNIVCFVLVISCRM